MHHCITLDLAWLDPESNELWPVYSYYLLSVIELYTMDTFRLCGMMYKLWKVVWTVESGKPLNAGSVNTHGMCDSSSRLWHSDMYRAYKESLKKG